MHIYHRKTWVLLVCLLALNGCGISDQENQTQNTGSTSTIVGSSPTIPMQNSGATDSNTQTLTPSILPDAASIATIFPSLPSVNAETATPFPTIRADDIKLTPVSSVVPVPTSNADEPFNQIVSVYRTSEITPSTNKASVIILGSVTEVGRARWTTPDAQRPADPRSTDNPSTIFRPIRVHVQTVVKGTYSDEEISLYGLGGMVGHDSMTWLGDDLHTFNVGDRVLIFLNQYPTTPEINGSMLWELIDKFTILDDRAVNTYKNLPLEEVVRTVTT